MDGSPITAPAGSAGGSVFDGAGVSATGPSTGSDGTTPPALAGYAFVDPHPVPDGSGSWTNLSDADYARLKAGLPPVAPDAVAPLGDVPGNAGTVPTITVTASAADNQVATAVLAGGTVAAGAAEGTLFEPALVRGSPLIIAPPSVLGNGVLADPIPPPVPTGPPPLVPPQVDNPLEAFASPPAPGQADKEGLQPTGPVDKPGEGGFTVASPVSNISQATATGDRPINLAPEGATHDEALDKVKEDHNIPIDEEPQVLPNERGGKNVPGSEILLYLDQDGSIVDVRHDYDGHDYPDDPNQDRGPHFNWDGPNGESDHYDYSGSGEPFGPLRRK